MAEIYYMSKINLKKYLDKHKRIAAVLICNQQGNEFKKKKGGKLLS